MSLDIIQERISSYTIQSKEDEENALKEICQEIALAGLARADFFKNAAFNGGTCLRILFQLKRFSEDLDFVLVEPQNKFLWKPYLLAIKTEFESFGLNCEASDRSEQPGNVKKAFLKEDSFGTILNLKFKRTKSDSKKIVIKLEIDVNPPAGSVYDSHYLQYPYPFSIVSQDSSSLFGSKCHALLCREYIKGRDWFDFLWYIQRKTQVNLALLKNALEQNGPYKGESFVISNEWLIEQLKRKILSVDWAVAKEDVIKFIPKRELHIIAAWNTELFLQVLNSMEKYLS